MKYIKKSIDYEGHSFVCFADGHQNIKIKPLTYPDLLYFNSNRDEVTNFISNFLEKEDNIKPHAKNIINFQKYKYLAN